METEKDHVSLGEPNARETGLGVLWKSLFYFLLLPSGVVLALKWLLDL